jgi:hypothetical protein
MRMTNLLLISIIAVCILLAGCKPYQYQSGKEIPVSVTGGENTTTSGDEGFKSEFEKLQKLMEEEGAAANKSAEEGKNVEEVVSEVQETPAAENVTETPAEDEAAAEENVTETPAEEEVAAAEETTTVSAVPEGATAIKVKEGELVNLAIKSDDPEGDTIVYTFTTPLDSKGKWQTKYGDAGTYKTTITASDGELSTSQDVYIVVEKVSRAPVITNFADTTVNEGGTITLSPKITDPEGGSVTLEYSGWMTTATKTTGYDDAGTYKETLKATSSSGESATASITITVLNKNRPPKIVSITNG